jgi:ornithine--oxo-acid transaminase
MNTGCEAVESAVKFARRWAYAVKGVPADKAKVLFAKNNFWGRSLAACGSSDDPNRYAGFGPFDGLAFELVNYDDMEDLERHLADPNVAGYVLEPI